MVYINIEEFGKKWITACNPINEMFLGCNSQVDRNLSNILMRTKLFLKPY